MWHYPTVLLAVVVNPRSGGGTDPDQVRHLLGRNGAQVVGVPIDELDGPLPTGVDRLVMVGGDGSIGVGARAAHAAGVPLAVVPTGTANDFARAVGLPTELDDACALAADPAATTHRYEVGELDGHPFVNAATAGLSVAASRHAESLKSRLGPLAYLVGAGRAGLTADPLRVTVRCDGVERFAGAVWQVTVGATGAFGGGSEIGGTRRGDGELDVAVVPAGPRVGLLRRAYGMRRAQLTAQPDVGHHRGATVEIDVPAGTEFNVDGDLREPAGTARFTQLPGGIAVVAR